MDEKTAMDDSRLLTALIDWLISEGLLYYHDICTRPDRTHGQAWVLRGAHIVASSPKGWSAQSARGALENAMFGNGDGNS